MLFATKFQSQATFTTKNWPNNKRQVTNDTTHKGWMKYFFIGYWQFHTYLGMNSCDYTCNYTYDYNAHQYVHMW
jgi:ribosome-associated toxin RatA of RatAB toxin-antitoxin module